MSDPENLLHAERRLISILRRGCGHASCRNVNGNRCYRAVRRWFG